MSETFTASRFMPALRYRDLSAAIDWLCEAFGFEKHDVVTAVDGTIQRARLKFGREMILLLPVRNSDPLISRPAEEIGYERQSCYFIIDDPDEHCRHAKHAGAEVIEMMEYDDGGRGYSCRDLEGHMWNFVTYDSSLPPDISDDGPKLIPDDGVDASNARLGNEATSGRKITRPVIFTMVMGTVIAAALGGLWLVTSPQLLSKASALLGRASGAEGVRSQVTGRRHVDRLPANKTAGGAPTEQASKATVQPSAQPTSLSPALLTLGREKRDDGDEPPTRSTNEPAPKAVALDLPQVVPRIEATTAEAAQTSEKGDAKRKPIARNLPDAREPQLKAKQLAPEQKADSRLWNCEPTATGEVACKPPGKKRAVGDATAPTAPKAKLITAPPSNTPSSGKPQARTADLQVWDCQARPPTGEVICRPMGAAP